MKSKAMFMIGAVVLGATALSACSQDTDSGSDDGGKEAGKKSAACERQLNNDYVLPTSKPADFKDGFTVALVRQSGVGDYFEQWGNGATKQIEAAGGKVKTFDARGNNSTQVSQFGQAINAKPDVIIVDHGLADSVNPKINEAVKKGIPVVVYDVDISNCDATYISQDDESIANKILDHLKAENPDGGKIAYVNVSGIAPLDTRNTVYKEFLKENPDFKQSAHFGKYTESVAADTATEGAAALSAAKDTTIAFAAYDELAKGTLIALRQNNMKDVKVYGVDVSTADIQLMTKSGSQWKATAATDPANVGAIVARAAIARAAGVDLPEKMTIPATLITQEQLTKNSVKNMADLREALPELATPDYLGSPWIPEIKPGQ